MKVLGDFIEKIGIENILKPVIANESVHVTGNDNGNSSKCHRRHYLSLALGYQPKQSF
jgi:hypothetical protein